MSQVDWSKAPEWAKKLGVNPHGENAWLGDEGYSYLLGNGGVVSWSYETAFAYTAFKIIEVRPAAWTGEGLPPVGVDLEVRHLEQRTHQGWIKAKTLYVGTHTCVWLPLDGLGIEAGADLERVEFRPIRTPEQIEAEEREQDAQALFELINPEGKWHKFAEEGKARFRAAVEAGYRKQVAP